MELFVIEHKRIKSMQFIVLLQTPGSTALSWISVPSIKYYRNCVYAMGEKMLSRKFWFCHCFSKFGDRFSWHTFQFILRTYMGRIGQTCFNQQCDFITVYSHEYAFDFNVKLKRMSHRSNAFHMLHYFFSSIR